MNTERSELKEQRYGRFVVRTWKRTNGNWRFAPWLFSIQEDGKPEKRFVGVPNYCETRYKALMRGLWRAKWASGGEFDKHYKSKK